MNKYTIYWNNGERQVLKGVSATNALLKAGYSAFDTLRIDKTVDGDDHNYVWNSETKQWEKKAFIS